MPATGLEPATPCLQDRCATNCAKPARRHPVYGARRAAPFRDDRKRCYGAGVSVAVGVGVGDGVFAALPLAVVSTNCENSAGSLVLPM